MALSEKGKYLTYSTQLLLTLIISLSSTCTNLVSSKKVSSAQHREHEGTYKMYGNNNEIIMSHDSSSSQSINKIYHDVEVSILTRNEVSVIFRAYDVSEHDAPKCQSETVSSMLCPQDERIPCGDPIGIESHCRTILGESLRSNTVQDNSTSLFENEFVEGRFLDPFQGCLKYVSRHIFDNNDNHACCYSEYCDVWEDLKYTEMEEIDKSFGIDDDDDSDFKDEEDYNYISEYRDLVDLGYIVVNATQIIQS